jgi:hypothetical protein
MFPARCEIAGERRGKKLMIYPAKGHAFMSNDY